MVLPGSIEDLVMLRPLGGTDDEICGILPELEEVRPASFSWPSAGKPGDFRSAKLLRQALRLGFRQKGHSVLAPIVQRRITCVAAMSPATVAGRTWRHVHLAISQR